MHITLNKFLFKSKAADSDGCYCGKEPQTLRHILVQCLLYTDPRKKPLAWILRTWMELNTTECTRSGQTRRPPAMWSNLYCEQGG